jgi:hypothetical protein
LLLFSRRGLRDEGAGEKENTEECFQEFSPKKRTYYMQVFRSLAAAVMREGLGTAGAAGQRC